MSYRIDYVDGTATAYVYVSTPTQVPGTGVQLHDDVQAAVDVTGELLGLDIGDTTMFGDPFDQDAAERAVTWAREQLELGTGVVTSG